MFERFSSAFSQLSHQEKTASDHRRQQGTINGIDALLETLHEVGIFEDELPRRYANWLLENSIDLNRQTKIGALTADDLRLFCQVFPKCPLREIYFKEGFHPFQFLRFLGSLHQLAGKAKAANQPDQETEISKIGQALTGLEADHPNWRGKVMHNLETILPIINTDWVYQRLGGTPAELVNNVNKYGIDYLRQLCVFYKALRKHPDRETYQRFFQNLDEQTFIELIKSEHWVKILETPTRLLEVTRQYFESKMTWGDSISALDRYFSRLGLGGILVTQLDRVLLEMYVQSEAKRQTTDVKTYQQAVDEIVKRVNGLSRGEKYTLLCQIREALGVEKILSLTETISQANRANENSAYQKWLKDRLTRARLRENKRHPVNTLMARLVGYEIEYPQNAAIMEKTGPSFFQSLGALRFKFGTERAMGEDYHETSPDPVFDPETAITVFRMYCQAGILDFYRETGFTNHFNASLRTENGFNYLAWSLYLTGAAYDPEENSCQYGIDFQIYDNESDYGEYFEGKLFDALTPDGFEWNFRSASYLAWALGAYQDATEIAGHQPSRQGLRRLKMNPYKKELARIWLDYTQKIKIGLKSVSLGLASDKFVVNYRRVKRLDSQIDLVYPNLASRYDGPRREVNGTLPIKLGRRRWSNIVAFSTDIVDESVNQILALANRVEMDTVAAIQKIDQASGSAKSKLIDKFIEDFQVALPENPSPEDRQNAFSEVKALFGQS